MPFKWKFFRFATWLTLSLLMLFVPLIILAWIGSEEQGIRLGWVFILFGMCILILGAHCINNLILLSKNFPDKLPVKRFAVFSITLMVLSMLVLIFFGILSGVGIYREYIMIKTYDNSADVYGMGAAVFMSLITISGLYCCICQIGLRKAIRRNYHKSIDSFLDEDNP